MKAVKKIVLVLALIVLAPVVLVFAPFMEPQEVNDDNSD